MNDFCWLLLTLHCYQYDWAPHGAWKALFTNILVLLRFWCIAVNQIDGSACVRNSQHPLLVVFCELAVMLYLHIFCMVAQSMVAKRNRNDLNGGFKQNLNRAPSEVLEFYCDRLNNFFLEPKSPVFNLLLFLLFNAFRAHLYFILLKWYRNKQKNISGWTRAKYGVSRNPERCFVSTFHYILSVLWHMLCTNIEMRSKETNKERMRPHKSTQTGRQKEKQMEILREAEL